MCCVLFVFVVVSATRCCAVAALIVVVLRFGLTGRISNETTEMYDLGFWGVCVWVLMFL